MPPPIVSQVVLHGLIQFGPVEVIRTCTDKSLPKWQRRHGRKILVQVQPRVRGGACDVQALAWPSAGTKGGPSEEGGPSQPPRLLRRSTPLNVGRGAAPPRDHRPGL